MELSHIATTKLGTNSSLYPALKAAAPHTRFTVDDEIMVYFETPEMKIPSGSNFKAEARANRDALRAATERGMKALEAIDELTIDNHFPVFASALVSGPASAIAAMLELPEVKGARSAKDVVFVLAADRGR